MVPHREIFSYKGKNSSRPNPAQSPVPLRLNTKGHSPPCPIPASLAPPIPHSSGSAPQESPCICDQENSGRRPDGPLSATRQRRERRATIPSRLQPSARPLLAWRSASRGPWRRPSAPAPQESGCICSQENSGRRPDGPLSATRQRRVLPATIPSRLQPAARPLLARRSASRVPWVNSS